jgi:hypothetical protein
MGKELDAGQYGIQCILAHPFCEEEHVFPQGEHAAEAQV